LNGRLMRVSGEDSKGVGDVGASTTGEVVDGANEGAVIDSVEAFVRGIICVWCWDVIAEPKRVQVDKRV